MESTVFLGASPRPARDAASAAARSDFNALVEECFS